MSAALTPVPLAAPDPLQRIQALVLDALRMEWRSIRLKKDPGCRVCGAQR